MGKGKNNKVKNSAHKNTSLKKKKKKQEYHNHFNMWQPRPGCKCTKWFIHPTIKKKTRDKNSKNKKQAKQVLKAYTKESRILEGEFFTLKWTK